MLSPIGNPVGNILDIALSPIGTVVGVITDPLAEGATTVTKTLMGIMGIQDRGEETEEKIDLDKRGDKITSTESTGQDFLDL